MKGKPILFLILGLVLLLIIVLFVTAKVTPENIFKSVDKSTQVKSESNTVNKNIYNQYEGTFTCENSIIEVSYLGNNQYGVTFKGTGVINGQQVRIMELDSKENILYTKDKPNAGGLIYSKDFQTIKNVDGSAATYTYKRT